MISESLVKICTKCNNSFNKEKFFSKNSAFTDGYQYYCKSCSNKYCRLYYARDEIKLHIRNIKKKYRRENSEKIKAKEKLFRENNKEKIKEYQKEYYRKKKLAKISPNIMEMAYNEIK